MKIVVACDAVIKRDYYIEIVEAVLDVVGDNCELYTLAHNPGSVIGHIEQRKIHSTFLSHKVKSWQDLLRFSYLIPSASKNLFIPCSVDLVINISRGFAGGFKKCENTKVVTFLVEDLNESFTQRPIWKRLATNFVRHFQLSNLEKADKLLIGNSFDLKGRVKRDFTQVAGVVKLQDFKPLPDGLFNRDYFLINTADLSLTSAQALVLKFKNEKFKFIGNDDHLSSLKFERPELFFGDRCGGELAPLLNGAKFLIDFEVNSLPVNTLRMLACGRAIFGVANKFLDFSHGLFEYKNELTVMQMSEVTFDKEKSRGVALGFEELKFKHLLKRIIHEFSHSEHSDECCSS